MDIIIVNFRIDKEQYWEHKYRNWYYIRNTSTVLYWEYGTVLTVRNTSIKPVPVPVEYWEYQHW